MALHFVSTAVLTADQAGQFNKEVLTDEGELLKKKAANSSKPLFMQLADQEALRQEQYDANAKLLRSGPRGLDEDEFDWVNQCQNEVDQLDSRRREQEKNELLEFKNNRNRAVTQRPVTSSGPAAKASSSSAVSGISKAAGNSSRAVLKSTLPVVAGVQKRKLETVLVSVVPNTKSSGTVSAKIARAGDSADSTTPDAVASNTSSSSLHKSASSLLAQYSDSDSD